MSDLLGDIQRAMELLDGSTPAPHGRLLSPLCGIYARHHDCRSAICECDCHIPTEEA